MNLDNNAGDYRRILNGECLYNELLLSGGSGYGVLHGGGNVCSSRCEHIQQEALGRVGHLDVKLSLAALGNLHRSLGEFNLDGGIHIGAADQVDANGGLFLLITHAVSIEVAPDADTDYTVSSFVHANGQLAVAIDAGSIDHSVDDLPLGGDGAGIANVVLSIEQALHQTAVVAIEVDIGLISGDSYIGILALEDRSHSDGSIRASGRVSGGLGDISGAHREHVLSHTTSDILVDTSDRNSSLILSSSAKHGTIQTSSIPGNRSSVLIGFESSDRNSAFHRTRQFGDVVIGDLLLGSLEGGIDHTSGLIDHNTGRTGHSDRAVGQRVASRHIERDRGDVGGVGQIVTMTIQFSLYIGVAAEQPVDAAAVVDIVYLEAGSIDRRHARLGIGNIYSSSQRIQSRYRSSAANHFALIIAGTGGNHSNFSAGKSTIMGNRVGGTNCLQRIVDIPLVVSSSLRRINHSLKDVTKIRRSRQSACILGLVHNSNACKHSIFHDRVGIQAVCLTNIAVRTGHLYTDNLANVGGLDRVISIMIRSNLSVDHPYIGLSVTEGRNQRLILRGRIRSGGQRIADNGIGIVQRYTGDLLVVDHGFSPVAEHNGGINAAALSPDHELLINHSGLDNQRGAYAYTVFGQVVRIELAIVPHIGSGSGGRSQTGIKHIAHNRRICAADAHAGDLLAGNLLGGSRNRTSVGINALHGQVELLAQIQSANIVVSFSRHNFAVDGPAVFHISIRRLNISAYAFANQRIVIGQLNILQFLVAGNIGFRAAGNAAFVTANANNLQLNQLADVAFLHGVGGIIADLNTSHAPVVLDAGRGRLQNRTDHVADNGSESVQLHALHAAADLNKRFRRIGSGAVAAVDAGNGQTDQLAGIAGQNAEGGLGAQFNAVNLPAVLHRSAFGLDLGFHDVTNHRVGVVDRHRLDLAAHSAFTAGSTVGTIGSLGQELPHHVAKRTIDGNIAPGLAVLNQRNGRAGAIQVDTAAAGSRAQPHTQTIAAGDVHGAQTRNGRTDITGTGRAKVQILVLHPADSAADLQLRPLSARLKHNSRRAHAVEANDAVGLAGAFAQADAISILTGNSRIFFCQCHCTHHRRKRYEHRRDQQDGK